MKRTVRILIPILLVIAILTCIVWYIFIYDRAFTRDMLLSFARHSENHGNHKAAQWFYGVAYSQSGNSDAVAIELANQYKASGNYTKAEYTLSNAIADGGGIDVYIALCKTYVEQDKLLDAVTMLDSIANPEIKEQLDGIRPAAPIVSPAPGFYSQYISVSLSGDESSTIYASSVGQYPSMDDDPYTQSIPLKDGENTIYSLAISDSGLVSPLSIHGFTVGGVVELMTFSDTAVEAEVRKLLNVSDNTELYTNDLWTIKSFTMPTEAKSYADLKHMAFLENLTIKNGSAGQLTNLSSLTNVSELTITETSVSQDELAIIGGLPLLKKLTLQSCGLTSIAPLEKASGLISLNLNNNTVRNIDAIRSMPNLQELNIQHNALSDLSALSSATALTKLDIAYNTLTTISPLSNLTALVWLDASTNSITQLGDLSKLTALTYLNLKNNQITSASAIAGCTALTELDISSNALTDIKSLSTLTIMMYFDFSHNQVSELPSFDKSCSLVTINGSNNLLSSLDSLGGLKNLNNVHMDYNTEISSVKALATCPVLIEVNVYATKVTDVTALTNQSIIVNYNPIQ